VQEDAKQLKKNVVAMDKGVSFPNSEVEDRIMDWITDRITEKKILKKKKIQKNQIVYEIIIKNKAKSGKLKYVKWK